MLNKAIQLIYIVNLQHMFVQYVHKLIIIHPLCWMLRSEYLFKKK